MQFFFQQEKNITYGKGESDRDDFGCFSSAFGTGLISSDGSVDGSTTVTRAGGAEVTFILVESRGIDFPIA